MGEIGRATLALRTALAKVLQAEEQSATCISVSRIGGDFVLKTEERQAAARQVAQDGKWTLRDRFKDTSIEALMRPSMTVDEFVTAFQTY